MSIFNSMFYNPIIEIPLGFLYANIAEWIIHKHILHGLGKTKDSIWRFHWAEHHKTARRNHMRDFSYYKPFWKDSARTKELLGLFLLAAAHIPLLFICPVFAITAMLYTSVYYFVHKKSHTTPEWGKRWLRHHYDHHMLKDQDKNWGVVLPLADWLFGTRTKK